MGAWGVKPNENDGAMDLSDMVEFKGLNILKKEYARKRIDSSYKQERSGAVYNLVKHNIAKVSKTIIRKAVQDLEDLIMDKEWVSTWRNSKEYISSTRRSIEYLWHKAS